MAITREPFGMSTPARVVSFITMRDMPWLGLVSRRLSSTTPGIRPGSALMRSHSPSVIGDEPHHLGDQLGRGLVAGHQELLADAHQLRHLERSLDSGLRVVDRGGQQLAEQVVAGFGPPLLELLDQEVGHLEVGAGVLDVLFVGDAGADGGGAGLGPAAEVVVALRPAG